MSEQHLTDEQPQHHDSGMDALIKHLETPGGQQAAPPEEPEAETDPLALEAVVPEAEVKEWQEKAAQEAGDQFDEDPLVPVVVAGAEHEVPLSELIRGYSREADYTRKTQSLAEERKAVEAERSQLMLAGREAVERSSQLAQQLQQEIQSNQPDANELARLRVENPGEYAARIADMQRRQTMLQHAQAQTNQYQQQQAAQRVGFERSQLSEKEPDFASDFVGTYAALGRWVTDPDGGGISVEDWNSEYDHTRILIAYRAFKASEHASVTKDRNSTVRAKVANLPRVRSGAPTEPGHSEREGYATALNQMKATNSVRDIANALSARDALKNTRTSK
jgi:hypothetical protein